MCTVTFIPVNDIVYITHNRDERKVRSIASAPAQQQVNGFTLLFPKDSKAGGTWIAVNENGNAAVLLNGGFVKHEPQPSYRRSRGLVLLDVIAADDMLATWQWINLRNIEPFTLICRNPAGLWECRWDGSKKYILPLNPGQAYIWSSVTLYDENIIAKRKMWFDDWKQSHPSPSMNDVMQFQCNAGEGDLHNDLRMNRDGLMLTVSITSMQLTSHGAVMKYLDLQKDSGYEQKLRFVKVSVES